MPSDAVILGIAGIAGTVGAGVGSQWVAAWLASGRDRVRFRHEERLADREELRERLDEAAGIIQRAISAHRTAYTIATLAQPGMLNDREVQDDVSRAQDAAEELSAMADRLAMRLTIAHDLYATLEGAGRALADAASSLWSLGIADRTGGDVRAASAEAKQAVDAAAKALSAARHTLTVEARKVVPTRLPE